MDWLLCLSVFLVIVLLLLVLQLMLKEPGLKEPPRLPALPLIGSMLSLWSSNPPHVLFQALQGRYGPTFSLMMGSHRVIVVNHHTHAREVLLKKGKVFAGRPRTVGNPSRTFHLLLPEQLPHLSSLLASCPVCAEGDHRPSD